MAFQMCGCVHTYRVSNAKPEISTGHHQPMIKTKPGKLYKCTSPGCQESHERRQAFIKWCSPECGLVIAEQRRAKAEVAKAKEQRKADREAKQAQKDRTDWASEAQDEVNRYVRYRDYFDGCISCDKPANWGGQWHASHFRSRGAASAIRFNLWNIHKACSECNKFKGGNIHGYTPKIIAKIGRGRVEWLKTQNQVVKHDIEYLKRVKAVFAKKANRQKLRIERGQ